MADDRVRATAMFERGYQGFLRKLEWLTDPNKREQFAAIRCNRPTYSPRAAMKFKRCAPLCGLVVLVLLSALMPVPGHAENPTRAPAQAVIDRIDLEPSAGMVFNRLRILFFGS